MVRVDSPVMTNSLRVVASFVMCVLAAPAGATAQEAGSLTGQWKVSVTSPEGVTPATLALSDDGGRLAGVLSSTRGQVPVEGSRTPDAVTVRFTISYEGAPLPIVLTAKPDGADALKGAADFGGQAAGSWSATRVPPTGISGAWAFSADVGNGTPTPGQLTLVEDKGAVSGYLLVRSRGVRGVVKGTQKDGELKLTVDGSSSNGPITIDMTGKATGESLTGTFSVADITGRWTATRP